jgi:GTP pyrophosphokinase
MKTTEAEPYSQLGPRFESALVYAAQLHAVQRRKGSEQPYIAHLISVAALVIESGGTEDEAIAGLLHDAVEDQGGQPRLEQVRLRFGDDVASIVQGCTDADVVPKPPWRPRKETYLQHLRESPPEVLRVSMCDKLHNARAILFDLRQLGPELWTRFTGGKDGSLWYYRALVEAYRAAAPPHFAAIIDELDRVVTEMELLA